MHWKISQIYFSYFVVINGREVNKNKKPSEKMIPTVTTSTFTDNEPFKKMTRQTENVSMTTPTSTVNIITKLDIMDLGINIILNVSNLNFKVSKEFGLCKFRSL